MRFVKVVDSAIDGSVSGTIVVGALAEAAAIGGQRQGKGKAQGSREEQD